MNRCSETDTMNASYRCFNIFRPMKVLRTAFGLGIDLVCTLIPEGDIQGMVPERMARVMVKGSE